MARRLRFLHEQVDKAGMAIAPNISGTQAKYELDELEVRTGPSFQGSWHRCTRVRGAARNQSRAHATHRLRPFFSRVRVLFLPRRASWRTSRRRWQT